MQQDRVVLHWARFGPYHLARLRAASEKLGACGWQVSGLELAGNDATYAWQEARTPAGVDRATLFPDHAYESLSPLALWRATWGWLSDLQPAAVAVSGYRTPDALALLAWSRRHRRPALLFTESKTDDAHRHPLAELVKKRLVAQYAAAVCGGTPHRDYLVTLGMDPGRIFCGYDVVDNDYFADGARAARQAPQAYAHLPGLDKPRPFFLASARLIPRKNMIALLQAYDGYRRRLGPDERPWRLVILGDGAERPALTRFCRDRDLADVTFAGFRQIEDLPAYYGLAQLFIHPPLQEQWGLVVNEAMAAGLPVLVSTACGCAPDLVTKGANGFTFNPRDPAALATLLLQATRGDLDLEQMGRTSSAIISAWGPARFASALEQALAVSLPQFSLA